MKGRVDIKEDEYKIIDVLKNSMLPKGQIIKDILGFCCDISKRIDRSITLPRRTIEAYY
jgi:hypothetical protein